MEADKVAGIKKKAQRQGRLIVFIDESGLSTQPTRARTWAPRGQTPLLQETFNWKSLSLIGGMVLLQFYFQLYAGSIKSLQVVLTWVRWLLLPYQVQPISTRLMAGTMSW